MIVQPDPNDILVEFDPSDLAGNAGADKAAGERSQIGVQIFDLSGPIAPQASLNAPAHCPPVTIGRAAIHAAERWG